MGKSMCRVYCWGLACEMPACMVTPLLIIIVMDPHTEACSKLPSRDYGDDDGEPDSELVFLYTQMESVSGCACAQLLQELAVKVTAQDQELSTVRKDVALNLVKQNIF